MKKLQMGMYCMLALAVVMGPVGCGDDDDGGESGGGGSGKGGSGGAGKGGKGGSGGETDGGAGEGGKGGSSAGSGGKGGSSAGSGGSTAPTDCPDIDDRETEEIDGELDADTTWSCDKLYILTDLVFVTGDSKLTVEAGTVVQGDPGSALIVTRGSQLVTEGKADAPVVFTSSNLEGEREGGDWGGVALLGAATINIDEARLEGLDPADAHGLYGGDEDDGSCGTLKYTRVEFGGFELSVDKELNGLTLAGCGSGTTASYVQVHRGSDDGIEVFGGAPKLDHIVLTGNKDDGFDCDLGNQVEIQFLVVQQDPTESDQGFEWDNKDMMDDITPRSSPTVYNATLIGANDAAGPQRGMLLRRGTAGMIYNTIVMGFPVGGIDINGAASAAQAMMSTPKLTVENSLFFENGMGGTKHFSEGETDNDTGFVEADFFTAAARSNVVDKDPELGDPYNLTEPDFVPAAGSPAADGAKVPPSGFDAADYLGAFEPGADDWTEGWTAYPEN